MEGIKNVANSEIDDPRLRYDTINTSFISTVSPDKPQMSSEEKSRLSYRTAGVNIDAGDNLVKRLKPLVARTQRDGWITGIGGFGGLFELPVERYQAPVLVSGTDGVGTKLKLAIEMNRHDTIGIDLVAMCVNDVIVCGAEPLYFLDYFATSVLSEDLAESVISGIARGCEIAGAALIGGETAEMPGMYHEGHYDLAGFCVGVVEKSKIIDGTEIRAGDHVLGLASSGIHSNGYSLVHAVRERSQVSLDDAFGQQTLGESLLTPTRIYASSINHLLKNIPVKGMAHITGGGLGGNVSRILPQDVQVQIDSKAWQRPAIFDWIQTHGDIEEFEMLRTFNCGIGMVVIVAREEVAKTQNLLEGTGENVMIIGEVRHGPHGTIIE